MATFDLPVTTRQSLVFYIALSTTLFYLGHAIPDTAVHVKVATQKTGDGSLPDQLSLVIQDDSGWETDVVLNRVQYIEPNIPVYTYCGGHKGGSDYQLVELEDNQNVAYYQSADHSAAFQVTKVDNSKHQFDFLLDGELVVNGTRCSLNHGYKSKRDAASSSPLSSDEVVYTLHELPPVVMIDEAFVDFSPHRQQSGSFKRQITRLGITSSRTDAGLRTVVSRDHGYSTSDVGAKTSIPRQVRRQVSVNIDVVAVVDFKKYSYFKEAHGTKAKAVQAMRQHYAAIFNGISAKYHSMESYNTINIRLVNIVADELSTAPWSTEPYRIDAGDKIQGGHAYENFLEFARGNGGDPFYPNDHILFFTGYDMEYNQTNVGGLAYPSTVCNRGSSSINEDINKYNTIVIAAHELAHALSTNHDGDKNTCLDSGYIMAPYLTTVTNAGFSRCSAKDIHNFIEDRLSTVEGQKCLWERLPVRNVGSSFSKDLLNQAIGPQ